MLSPVLKPSEIPLEAESNIVELWLDLVYRLDGKHTKPTPFEAVQDGIQVYNLLQKYQTECVRLAWRQTMEFTLENIDNKGRDNFDIFVWACKHEDLDLARRALGNLQYRVRDKDGTLMYLTPWRMSDATAEELDYANYRRLVRACYANRLSRDDVLCRPCHGFGKLQDASVCTSCRGFGTWTADDIDACDWPGVARDFDFDDH